MTSVFAKSQAAGGFYRQPKIGRFRHGLLGGDPSQLGSAKGNWPCPTLGVGRPPDTATDMNSHRAEVQAACTNRRLLWQHPKAHVARKGAAECDHLDRGRYNVGLIKAGGPGEPSRGDTHDRVEAPVNP